MIIKTADDWWEVLDKNMDIFLSTLPGEMSTKIYNRMNAQLLVRAQKERNSEPWERFLFQLWTVAPDKPYIHSWPGWSDLCELLAEAWVLYEQV